MGDFYKAYALVAQVEGNYSDDPDDPGGETVGGIARKRWPDWSGWQHVDAAKREPGFPANLKNSPVQACIKDFYKQEFWDCFSLDEFVHPLSEEIFEQAVNLGHSRVVKHLQLTLNALNYDNRRGQDLLVDRAFGPATLERLRQTIADRRAKSIQFGINGLQCAYYIELSNKSKRMRKYTNGWLAQRGKAES